MHLTLSYFFQLRNLNKQNLLNSASFCLDMFHLFVLYGALTMGQVLCSLHYNEGYRQEIGKQIHIEIIIDWNICYKVNKMRVSCWNGRFCSI